MIFEHCSRSINWVSIFVQDKQIDNLIEKLTLRFRNAKNDREMDDLNFCIAILQHIKGESGR